MPAYAALLRAINAGVALPMPELKAMAEAEGLERARTYIASGNLLFRTARPAAEVQAALAALLAERVGAPAWLTLRTAAELAQVVAANPFAEHPGNRTVALFLDAAPPADALAAVRHQTVERLALGVREIYVAYDIAGMGKSKLAIPAAKAGTGRNMNTVAKLAELAGGL